MNIQLPTGKTINISVYEFLFTSTGKVRSDEESFFFYQACIADDLGAFVENPFSNVSLTGKLEPEDQHEIEEVTGEEADLQ